MASLALYLCLIWMPSGVAAPRGSPGLAARRIGSHGGYLMSSWGTAAGPAVMGYVFALNNEQYGGAYLFAAAAAALGLVLFASGGPLHPSIEEKAA